MNGFKETNAALVLLVSKDLLIEIAVAVVTIILFPLGAVCWLFQKQRKVKTWQKWYAWRPIRIVNDSDIEWVWLQTVERYSFYSVSTYRRIKHEQ